MRIAILAPHAGYIVGGVEIAALNLRKTFLKDHECEVFSLAESPWTIHVPGRQGPQSPTLIRKFRLNYLNHLTPFVYLIKNYARAEFSYCSKLPPFLDRFQPDVLINLNFTILALYCLYYRRSRGVPFLNVGQSGLTYGEVKSARTRPDAYVALTPAAKRYIETRTRNVRIEVIPNGVDLEIFHEAGDRFRDDEIAGLGGHEGRAFSRPFILSTSRLIGEKRLDLLIRAAARLDRGTVIFAGYGEARNHLQSLGDRLLPGRCLFVGTHDPENLAKLYRSCDLFSLPSKDEPFGNVVVEAMASGLPVVATDDEGFRWMVGEKGGILTDVTDAAAFARALKRAVETDFGAGPAEQAERFAWTRVAEMYTILIRNILEARS